MLLDVSRFIVFALHCLKSIQTTLTTKQSEDILAVRCVVEVNEGVQHFVTPRDVFASRKQIRNVLPDKLVFA